MKYCFNCGQQLAEDDVFCGNCGTKNAQEAPPAPPQGTSVPATPQPQNAPAAQPAPAHPVQPQGAPMPAAQQPQPAPAYPVPAQGAPKPGNNKKTMIIVFSVLGVCLIGLAVALVLLLGGGGTPPSSSQVPSSSSRAPVSSSGTPSSSSGAGLLPPLPQPAPVGLQIPVPGNYFSSYAVGDEHFLFATNGAQVSMGENYPQYHTSADGMLAFYLQKKEDSYERDLYVLDTRGDVRLVQENAMDLSFCADSDLVFYQAGSSGTDLYCYSYSEDTSSLVATDVSSYVVSPNGAYVLFSNYEFLSHMKIGSAAERVLQEERPIPLSISNDGSLYTYALQERGSSDPVTTVYFTPKGGDAATIEFKGYASDSALNATGDDILLLSPLGIHRYSKAGLEHVTPEEGKNISLLMPGMMYNDASGGWMVFFSSYATSSFSSFYYHVRNANGDNALMYYESGSVPIIIAAESYFDGYQITSDLSHVIYSGKNGLFRARVEDGEPVLEQVSENTASFAASPDGSTIFFIRRDTGENYSSHYNLYLWEDGTAELIGEDVVMDTVWAGGPNGTSCTFLAGDSYDIGDAYFYSKEGGLQLIAANAGYISPPSANNTFYLTTNFQPIEGQAYRKTCDILAYGPQGLETIASGVEFQKKYWRQDWYYTYLSTY